ncbi:NEW3 domain-containing protein [Sporosarcina sp. NPDC096371]|uniref:NEW3 domain-containing protein n=1 Tax=Sporosarcina sp. NPDC096371 TaxID=3364530 RepID=UPI003827113B
MKKLMVLVVSLVLLLSVMGSFPQHSSAEQQDVDLWNSLKPLGTTVTFLNTGAHPDDERSDLLAYLSRGLGVKTASLIANRGEGGQNEIGNELGNGLGIIRSQEMIEAAKITGVKAYHLSETTSDSIFDFGFSKTAEETLATWGEDLTYERLIRFIRSYQPDIIMPSFRDVDSQHGHHRTMTVLTDKAFLDAADPTVFPEQLKQGLQPWQTTKHYLPADSAAKATLSLEIGMYDRVYGMSYPQLGEASRYLHKSQGMGNDILVAPRAVHFELKNSAVPSKTDDSLFAGIPYDLSDWGIELLDADKKIAKQLIALQYELEKTQQAYPNRSDVFDLSQKSLQEVRKAIKSVNASKLPEATKVKLRSKLHVKDEQLQEVSYVSSGVELIATLPDNVLSQGEKTVATLMIKNTGTKVLTNFKPSIKADKDWKFEQLAKLTVLKPGQTAKVDFKVTVPQKASYYHAYKEPALQAAIEFKDQGETVNHTQNFEGTVAVLPEFSLTTEPANIVINTKGAQKAVPVTVKVKNYQHAKAKATVKIHVPKGWTTSADKQVVTFAKKHESQEVTFNLTPPANMEEGSLELDITAEWNGKKFTSTIQEIEYEHIGKRYLEYPATVHAVAFELNIPEKLKVGYIDSGFDTVADALTNAGMDITLLTDKDIESGDLSQFDTIVVGIRAYLSREALLKNNNRLLKYVEDGGHVVMQYHKPGDKWDAEKSAPYKLVIGNPSIRWRVTDENATVKITKPDSTLLSFPNNINDSDWENWVQERGLYYPMEWASNYETVVSMADPNEKPFEGGILMTSYGKGTYIYTNLVLYRQIQSQVPGGYRILTNLISHGVNN